VPLPELNASFKDRFDLFVELESSALNWTDLKDLKYLKDLKDLKDLCYHFIHNVLDTVSEPPGQAAATLSQLNSL
jgi:hypothetical protein